MADDPFYSPNHRPAPARLPRPGEPLWSVRHGDATWSAELRYHGECGVEAQILRDNEFVSSYRFSLREQAVRWAAEQRRDIERWFLDD